MQPQLITMYADKLFLTLFALTAIALFTGMLIHWLWRWVCHGFAHHDNMPSPLDYERWGRKLHQQIGIDGLVREHIVDAWLASRSKAQSCAPQEIPDDHVGYLWNPALSLWERPAPARENFGAVRQPVTVPQFLLRSGRPSEKSEQVPFGSLLVEVPVKPAQVRPEERAYQGRPTDE